MYHIHFLQQSMFLSTAHNTPVPPVAPSRTMGRPSMTPTPAFHDARLRATAGSEVAMSDAADSSKEASGHDHFTIAVDFGTTFSSVSFTALAGKEFIDRTSLHRIKSIDNYPKDPRIFGQPRKDVPTEIWYPQSILSEEEDFCKNEQSSGEHPVGDENGDMTEERFEDSFLRADEYCENNVSRDLLWGYMVEDALRLPSVAASSHEQNRRVSRSKLLLYESELTKKIRDDLRETLRELRKRKLIKEDEDVVTEYLTCLFWHVKRELERHHSFSNNHSAEFVLCVPTIWTPRSCRKMHAAMATAMRRAGFKPLGSGGMDNLFIVSEPEAAAAFVLTITDDIKPNDTFVLIDAGGGTVDAVTYTVDRRDPPRLREEAVVPGGGLCGSSYINQEFRDFAYDKLKDETYLEDPEGNITIEGIIESLLMNDFENCFKRQVDFTIPKICKQAFFIPGLRPNKEKGFKKNEFRVLYDDFKKIFRPCLTGVATLMKDQLDQARQKQLDVQVRIAQLYHNQRVLETLTSKKKVILIGGFAESLALVTYLKRVLERISEAFGSEIQLIRPSIPGTCGTAVASGAVLWALNKDDGPARAIRSSYGILRGEPYEPNVYPAHKEVNPSYNRLDGDQYVCHTIDWFIKKGEIVPPKAKFPITVIHNFDTYPFRKFVCQEVLYVSDHSTESHYQRTHAKNEGYEIAGTYVVDMTFLKTEGLIKPVVPEPGQLGKKRYKVEFELVVEVDDRNMRYSARWPPGDDAGVLDGTQGQISIAAAFQPGTR